MIVYIIQTWHTVLYLQEDLITTEKLLYFLEHHTQIHHITTLYIKHLQHNQLQHTIYYKMVTAMQVE